MAKRIAPDQTPRGWAPTARDAVLACAPMTSLLGALGLGGTGYLMGRPDMAACGAVVGGVGIYAERLQAREVRLRARRDRARFRAESQALLATMDDLRREISTVREDMEERTRSQTAALELALRQVTELARSDGDLRTARAAAPAGEPDREAPSPSDAGPVTVPVPAAAPVTAPAAASVVPAAPVPAPVAAATTPAAAPAAAALASRAGVWVQEPRPARPGPAGTRSGSHFFVPAVLDTGGIPLLDPGPMTRVGARTPAAAGPVADALVYAALARQEVDEATERLAHPELVPAGGGSLERDHGGDLVVVRRGRHVA